MMPHHALQKDLHTVDIVVEIQERLFHALSHQRIRCEVNDSLDAVLREDPIQHRRVPDIPFIELCLRMQRPSVPCLQVVDDHDFLVLRNQLMHCMRPDISGSAANQNRHIPFLLISPHPQGMGKA